MPREVVVQSLGAQRDRGMKTCSIEGCSRVIGARGWCRKHYVRRLRANELGEGLTVLQRLRKERNRLGKRGKARCSGCSRIRSINKFYPSQLQMVRCRCRTCMSSTKRLKIYGITQDQFRMIKKAQAGRCAICGVKFKRGVVDCQLDHNHLTGQVRGALCRRCNQVLGKMNDNAALLYSAARYLDDAEMRAKESGEE